MATIVDGPVEVTREDELRARALRRLGKRREFAAHALVYVLVNGFIVAIWAVTSRHGFFWPIFPMGGWGIGLVMNAWETFRREEFREEAIRREVSRLRRHGTRQASGA
jgi:2TM domain